MNVFGGFLEHLNVGSWSGPCWIWSACQMINREVILLWFNQKIFLNELVWQVGLIVI